MRDARIVCGKVNTIREIMDNPQVKAREVFVEVEDPVLGQIKIVNCPIKSMPNISRTSSTAPMLGNSTTQVLCNLLGYSKAQVIELLGKGVIFIDDRIISTVLG